MFFSKPKLVFLTKISFLYKKSNSRLYTSLSKILENTSKTDIGLKLIISFLLSPLYNGITSAVFNLSVIY